MILMILTLDLRTANKELPEREEHKYFYNVAAIWHQ